MWRIQSARTANTVLSDRLEDRPKAPDRAFQYTTPSAAVSEEGSKRASGSEGASRAGDAAETRKEATDAPTEPEKDGAEHLSCSHNDNCF